MVGHALRPAQPGRKPFLCRWTCGTLEMGVPQGRRRTGPGSRSSGSARFPTHPKRHEAALRQLTNISPGTFPSLPLLAHHASRVTGHSFQIFLKKFEWPLETVIATVVPQWGRVQKI